MYVPGCATKLLVIRLNSELKGPRAHQAVFCSWFENSEGRSSYRYRFLHLLQRTLAQQIDRFILGLFLDLNVPHILRDRVSRGARTLNYEA